MHTHPGEGGTKRSRKKSVAATRAAGTDDSSQTGEIDLSSIQGSLGYNLRRAQVAEFQAFATIFGPYEIRPVQYALLALLHDNPGVKQAQLGEALSIKRANQVALIDELEQRGLVERRERTDDKRSHALHLTAAGRKLANKLLELHAQHEASIAERLGVKERDQLLKLLKRLLNVAPSSSGFPEA